MSKKAQKVKKNKRSELLMVNLNAAGIDVSSSEYQVCVPEDRDENHNRRFDSFTCDLREISKWLKECKIETVAMEATGIYWIQLYLFLQEAGFDVIVCNAKHIKNLGEKKTDYVDAGWIQLLHTYGLLNDSFQPDNNIREIKDLNRCRDRLVERCNQSILRLQKSLEIMNIKIHKVLSDIKGKSGLAILKAIISGERDPEKLYGYVNLRVKASKEEILKSLEGNWIESQIFILKQELDTYHYTKRQMNELDIKIEELLKAYLPLIKKDKQEVEKKELIRSKKKMDANNAPKFDMEKYAFEILGVNITRIPGISNLSALKIVSELGPDFINKFPTSDKFCAWANLVPNNKKSGGKQLSSKIPKRTNYIGQTLRVAANTLKSHKGYLGELFRAKKGKLGYNQAIVAVAHKLARIIYKMVKDKVEYNEEIERNKNKEIMIKKLEYYERKLEKTKKEIYAIAS
jgi:transposase